MIDAIAKFIAALVSSAIDAANARKAGDVQAEAEAEGRAAAAKVQFKADWDALGSEESTSDAARIARILVMQQADARLKADLDMAAKELSPPPPAASPPASTPSAAVGPAPAPAEKAS